MKRAIACGAVFAWIALYTPMSVGAQATSILRGKVTGKEGNPVEGVSVLLKQEPDRPIARAVTDKDGRYWITGILPGDDYFLVTKHIAYAPVERKGITIEEGDTLTIDLELNEKPIELDTIQVEQRNRWEKFRADVTAKEIAESRGIVTAQDIFRVLRPYAIQSRTTVCGGGDLKVYVDSARVDFPLDTLKLYDPHRREELLSEVIPSLRRLINPIKWELWDSRSLDTLNSWRRAQLLMEEMRKENSLDRNQSNLYAVWLALGRVHGGAISKMRIIDSMDRSVPMEMRNSIWIETKSGKWTPKKDNEW